MLTVAAEDAERLTPIRLKEATDTLKLLSKLPREIIGTYGELREHPFAGVRNADLTPFTQEDLIAALNKWAHTLRAVQASLETAPLPSFREGDISTDRTRQLVEQLSQLPAPRSLPFAPQLLHVGTNLALTKAVRRFHLDLEDYRERRAVGRERSAR